MQITVNGKSESLVEESVSLKAYLKKLDINPHMVAVEINLDVIEKSEYENTLLCDGDNIEIVRFVGGGAF